MPFTCGCGRDGELCRILSTTGLQEDEAVLTGESLRQRQGPDATGALALAERRSMLYAGTTVVAGEVEAVEIAVVDATQARRGLAAVPEGLPVLASLAQFAAAERLSGEKVRVRNPLAIESLGRVDVICHDKTGTLTSGHIRLREVSDGSRSMPPTAWMLLAHLTDRGLLEGAEEAGLTLQGCQPEATLPVEPSRGYHASLFRQEGRRLLCVKGFTGDRAGRQRAGAHRHRAGADGRRGPGASDGGGQGSG